MALRIGSLSSTSTTSLNNNPRALSRTTGPSFEPYLKRAMENLRVKSVDIFSVDLAYETDTTVSKTKPYSNGLQPGKVYVYKPGISMDKNGFNYYLEAM